MDTIENKNAANYVINKIRSLLGDTEVSLCQKDFLNYNFNIPLHKIEIIFERATMEDFQVAIEKHRNSDQYQALENFINFRIYITLGQTGLIPKFLITHEFLKEKRDWLQNYNGGLDKPKWLYGVFCEGLKTLSDFLDELVTKYKVTSKEITQEQEDIKHLLEFYEDNHHFTERNISVTSLGYFKAAAVCVILRKEKEKKSIVIPRILQARDQEIYKIVTELREGPFPQIKMPACIEDYAEHIKSNQDESEHEYMREKLDLTNNWVPFASNKQVFLAHRFNEIGLRNSVVAELTKEGFTVKEGKVEDLGYISDDILDKIKTSGFFLALLTPSKKFKQGQHSTSTWVLMEIGSAIAFSRKVLVLAKDSVDQEEYVGKLQSDCQYETFNRTNFENKLKAVTARIKKEWEKSA